MQSERKAIPGLPGYFASRDGSIWKLRTGKWARLKARANTKRKGYLQVAPFVDGKNRTFTVHRLVMLAFVGERPAGMEVSHKDGDKSNNALSNLKYATPIENNLDKRAHGTQPEGESCHLSKLTEKQVIAIRKLHATGWFTTSYLARVFGVTDAPVYLILKRKTWKHV